MQLSWEQQQHENEQQQHEEAQVLPQEPQSPPQYEAQQHEQLQQLQQQPPSSSLDEDAAMSNEQQQLAPQLVAKRKKMQLHKQPIKRHQTSTNTDHVVRNLVSPPSPPEVERQQKHEAAELVKAHRLTADSNRIYLEETIAAPITNALDSLCRQTPRPTGPEAVKRFCDYLIQFNKTGANTDTSDGAKDQGSRSFIDTAALAEVLPLTTAALTTMVEE
eukprot:COSAG05_NODE_6380_length_970_cov_0.693456_2_plen_218_part_00